MSKMSISKLLRPESVLNLKLFAATGYDMKSRKRCIVSFTKHCSQVQTACMAPSEEIREKSCLLPSTRGFPPTFAAGAVKRDHSETLDSRTVAATCSEVSCDREEELEAMDDVLESLSDSTWLCASAREATQDLGLQPPANAAEFYLTCPGELQGPTGI
jgi:hypothetical protein